MDRKAIALLAEQLAAEIGSNSELMKLVGSGALDKIFVDSAVNELTGLTRVLSSLPNAATVSRQDAANVVAQCQSAIGSVQILAAAVGGSSHSSSGGVTQWLKSRIFPSLQGIWSSIAGVLSTLSTVKEWKIKCGLSGSFGIGNADIEITFG